MSEPEAPKTEDADKSKPSAGGSSNKLLLIIALGNFLGTFALGGYLAYDKLVAGGHAAAQAAPKADAHGKADEHGKTEGHGEEAKEEEAEGGHGEKAEGGHGEKKAEGGHGGGGDVDESIHPPDGPGPIMALEPIVTNLADPDSDRYLKVTAQLRVTSESAKAEVEASLVPIRSSILMYLSSLNMAQITGAEKRREIQGVVRRLANDAMPATRIRFVYFTEFVVQ
ncbi:MAG TPA: flagellar basal body-associated FliL family protein [Polyangiales bacterium]